MILSFVAIGLLWTLIFNYNYGLINFLFQAVGLVESKARLVRCSGNGFPGCNLRRLYGSGQVFTSLFTWPGCNRSPPIYMKPLRLTERLAGKCSGASRFPLLNLLLPST